MGESNWTHLGILAAVAAVFVPIWLDLRKGQRDTRKVNEKMHQENSTRLTKIETMIEPIWHWYNKSNGNDIR